MGNRTLVRDLMTVGVQTCSLQTPIKQIARLLLECDHESVVVLDPEGHAQGVVSQDELVQAYSMDDWDQLTAEQVMREDAPQVPPDIPLTAAAQIMRDQHIRAVFLMHHSGGVNYPAGVLTYRHLLRHLASQNDSELLDLGNQAARKAPIDTFIERRDAARRKAESHHEEV